MRARGWIQVLAGLLVAVALAVPASAHGSDGALALETRSTADPLEVEVRARLTYVNDGDPVSGASVTVEASGPAGESLAPQTMAPDGEGIYAATAVLPTAGAWTFRVTATDPAATAEVAFTAAQPASSTPTPTTPVDTTAPPPVLEERDEVYWGQLGALGLVVAAGAIVFFLVLRRRQRRA